MCRVVLLSVVVLLSGCTTVGQMDRPWRTMYVCADGVAREACFDLRGRPWFPARCSQVSPECQLR